MMPVSPVPNSEPAKATIPKAMPKSMSKDRRQAMSMPQRWNPKRLREALAAQQTHSPDEATSDAIDYLIAILDSHRPLGPDGKHGDRHTLTCGCEDKR